MAQKEEKESDGAKETHYRDNVEALYLYCLCGIWLVFTISMEDQHSDRGC